MWTAGPGIPVAGECVCVCLSRTEPERGEAGGGEARRRRRESEVSGVSSGVIGMSGSKNWDEAEPRSLWGLEICACTRESKHRRHLQAAVCTCVRVCVCVWERTGGEGLPPLLRTGGWGCGAGWWWGESKEAGVEWTQSALCFHKTCGMWEQKQMCLI